MTRKSPTSLRASSRPIPATWLAITLFAALAFTSTSCSDEQSLNPEVEPIEHAARGFAGTSSGGTLGEGGSFAGSFGGDVFGGGTLGGVAPSGGSFSGAFGGGTGGIAGTAGLGGNTLRGGSSGDTSIGGTGASGGSVVGTGGTIPPATGPFPNPPDDDSGCSLAAGKRTATNPLFAVLAGFAVSALRRRTRADGEKRRKVQ